MTTYRLTNADSKLLSLAVAYHLARPGSELDRDTQQPSEQGLAAVARSLDEQMETDIATIQLGDRQRELLLNAMSGALNELKAYPLMPSVSGRRHSAAPGFDEALRRLFPEVSRDPDEASQLAGHLLALRRRFEAAG